jgi:hypothetical protein
MPKKMPCVNPDHIEGKTPYEVWKGMKPNVSHIRVFRSTVFVHILKEERGSFDFKAVKRYVGCVMLC